MALFSSMRLRNKLDTSDPAKAKPLLQPDGSELPPSPVPPAHGEAGKAQQGGEQRQQQEKAGLHTLGTPGN